MNAKKVCICLSALFFSLLSYYLFYHQEGPQGSLDDKMVLFLQNYIRINTSHPTPAYQEAINFLKKQAEQDGFLHQEVILPSGNPVFIITYPGTKLSLPSLLLNHHMDVVPAQDAGWEVPPFSGEIHHDAVVGRGAQDMKGIAATHYFALKALKDAGVCLQRTVHLIAVPEEEVGGFKGTKQFLATELFKNLNVGFVIDEGHASGDSASIDIKVAERKPIQIQVTSTGTLAHGSHLECQNALHNLVQFLHQIVLMHDGQKRMLSEKQAGELLSCNITSLQAGVQKEDGHIALNVVPDIARATIDIRVPPTMKKRDLIKMLDERIALFGNLSYEILAEAQEEPELGDYQTELYKAVETAIITSGLQVRPHFFEASSDLRYYQDRGIVGVGLTPFAIEDNIHGVNESVPIEQLIFGKNILIAIIKTFCTVV